MTKWIRFEREGEVCFGTLEDNTIAVYQGDMFDVPERTDEQVPLEDVRVLTPTAPTKMLCIWNNFHALAEQLKVPAPDEPLYLLKAPSAFAAHDEPIRRPETYAGNIVYEGELGIVIGKTCRNVSVSEATDYIFGYTCVNDVTAADIISRNATFAQWARAKSFDTFGIFGPVIATDLDPSSVSVRTTVNGVEKQNYPVSDMFFSPAMLVSLISRDVTLMPGDVIACGTSIGVSAMREARNEVEVSIEGIGTLRNALTQEVPFKYFAEPQAPQRICVVGAGAIGGLLAAKLALAGNDVTVIDVGSHLSAIQENGLKLIWQDGTEQLVRLKAVANAREAGPQDLVVLAVKAHFLEEVARELDSMLQADTVVLTVQNGLPWWYFQQLGGAYDGSAVECLDPSGILASKIESERIIGCVVYPAAEVPAPGVIRHVEGDRLPIGELNGIESERAKRLHDLLVGAGFRSRVLADIRSEIWLKAWGNLSFNPISALTHSTLSDICQYPETRQLAADMMAEAQNVAEKLGVRFRHTIEKRISGAESVGAHKTSMLQDVEFGRSLETEALIGAIIEIGKMTQTPTPSIQAVYACVKLLNKVMLTEGAGVRIGQAA